LHRNDGNHSFLSGEQKAMNLQEIAQRLHDRATRGDLLSAEERVILDDWYARQDAEEERLFAIAVAKQKPSSIEQLNDLVAQMAILIPKLEEGLAESKRLQEELVTFCRQSLDPEIADIRQAYPLMDAVARQEGWDDPEMDSYNIYARKPQQ
jgi:hypothetical protein